MFSNRWKVLRLNRNGVFGCERRGSDNQIMIVNKLCYTNHISITISLIPVVFMDVEKSWERVLPFG